MSEASVCSLALDFTVLNVQGIAYLLEPITAAIKEMLNVWQESEYWAWLYSLFVIASGLIGFFKLWL